MFPDSSLNGRQSAKKAPAPIGAGVFFYEFLAEGTGYISRFARDYAGRRLGNKNASIFASLGSYRIRTYGSHPVAEIKK